MLTRILTPLDGSELAERAVAVAARLAHASGGALLLLRVYTGLLGETAPELVAHSETADAREARAYLERIRQRPDLDGLVVETLALSGATARAILDAVAEFHADTIVMSSHGRSGITRWALGSVAEHVVRHAPVPVLVLRGNTLEPLATAPTEGSAWSVCIGLDGSELAEQTLAPAAQLLRAVAGAAPAEALLARIMKPPTPADDELAAVAQEAPAAYERRLAASEAYLQTVAERLRVGDLAPLGIHARWSVIQAADSASALIQAAEHPAWVRWHTANMEASEASEASEVGDTPAVEHQRASLIALATHGRGGFQRWALGSVAERVLEGTSLPLLLVRSSAPSLAETPPADPADPAGPAAPGDV